MAKLGIAFRVTLEKRIAGAEKVGKHKTSMLQDVEAGREPEIDALVGSVIELARLTGTPTPHIDTVYALVKLLARTMQDQRTDACSRDGRGVVLVLRGSGRRGAAPQLIPGRACRSSSLLRSAQRPRP